MKKMSFEVMERIVGGRTRSERNAGCMALGLAAGIASGLNPLVGGFTTLGCMLTVDFD